MQEFKGIPVVGKKVVEARNQLVLSQEELAAKMGMTKNNLSRIERMAVAGMNRESFRKLADLLRVSLEDLRARLAPPDEAAPANRVPFFVSPEDLDLWTQMAQAEDPPTTPEQLFTDYAQEFRNVLTKRRLEPEGTGTDQKPDESNRLHEAHAAAK